MDFCVLHCERIIMMGGFWTKTDVVTNRIKTLVAIWIGRYSPITPWHLWTYACILWTNEDGERWSDQRNQ